MQPLLQWKSSKYYIFWVCVCSLNYPRCNAHAPYCHLWPVRLYNSSPHYLINGTILEQKKISNWKKYVVWFSLQLLSETFLILRRIEQDMINNVYWYSRKPPVIIAMLWRNLNFLDRFSKKIFKYQISWKSLQWKPSFWMRMDRRTGMTNVIVAFRNFLNAPKKSIA